MTEMDEIFYEYNNNKNTNFRSLPFPSALF
jgi:hypothetical protein